MGNATGTLVLVFMACGLSCGPVQSTAYLMDAQSMLDAARSAHAPSQAPYEWTLATTYLHKAREEVGNSEYEAAVIFAQKATKFATDARDVSNATIRAVPLPANPSKP